MIDAASTAEKKSAGSRRAKIISTVLVFAAIALQLWQALTPLPTSLQPLTNITAIILSIHAVEGLISASLILRYRLNGGEIAAHPDNILSQKLPENTALAVIKAGLYAFFVGTVGLLEVIEATKPPEGRPPKDKPPEDKLPEDKLPEDKLPKDKPSEHQA